MRRRLVVAAAALALLVSFDHGMRLQQEAECRRGDEVPCPQGMWLWEGRP